MENTVCVLCVGYMLGSSRYCGVHMITAFRHICIGQYRYTDYTITDTVTGKNYGNRDHGYIPRRDIEVVLPLRLYAIRNKDNDNARRN